MMLNKKWSTLIFSCFYLFSFGQVKNYSKVKKISKNTYNFLENTKNKSKQYKDDGLYIVYSDRDENNSYLDELGLKQGKEQKFLTAFFVIDQTTDFYEVVKFNPEVIGKPKGLFSFFYGSKYNFNDKKNVEYIGWMQKDKLLRFSHPKVSKPNLKPLVYYLGINNTNTLFDIRDYVKKDSVNTFKDPDLKIKSKKLFNTNQFVYLYKYNSNKTAALISNINHMQASDSIKRIMGWVPSILIKKIGQRKVLKTSKNENVVFSDSDTTEYIVKSRSINNSLLFVPEKPCNQETTFTDSTSVISHVPLNVWNHYNNKLINVKGKNLFLRDIPIIREENKTFNFHFVFDCSPKLREKFVMQISSLQSIWLLISEDERFKNYNFTFSASSFGCSNYYNFPKSDSFVEWLDYLQKIFLNDTVTQTKEYNNQGLSKCFSDIITSQKGKRFENNIVMVMGEDNLGFEIENNKILENLAKIASRLIFFQLENKSNKKHQDYILQAKQILDVVADKYSNHITNYIIDNNLVLKQNSFTTLASEENNVYLFDSPNKSMYTGGVVFPKINQVLTPVSFDIALDSILSKSIKRNNILLNSLEKGNKKLGFLRSTPTESVNDIIKKDSKSRKAIQIPKINRSEAYLETSKLNLKLNNGLESGYLFSKKELNTIIESYKSVIPLINKNVTKKQRKVLCKKYKSYYTQLNKLLFYKHLSSKSTIGKLIEIKTGIEVSNKHLNRLRIKDIKKKSKLTNQEYVILMKSLRSKINHLETLIENSETKTHIDGSGKTYYYVSENILL